jgi:pimeloyl-ACP methyl ester carboxylesterase
MKAITAVLLPGLDGTGDLFARFVAATPKGITPVVVDYPTSKTSVDILDRCARERLTDRCIIVAESFSGAVGVRVAADDRVQALILCNSFVKSPILPALRFLVLPTLFAIPIPDFLFRYLLLGRESDPMLIKNAKSALGQLPPSVIAHRVRQILQTDERGTVRSLRKPILYLRGQGDRLVSERSWRELKATRPDAEIFRIVGPHLLLQAAPAECWAAIQRFVLESATG